MKPGKFYVFDTVLGYSDPIKCKIFLDSISTDTQLMSFGNRVLELLETSEFHGAVEFTKIAVYDMSCLHKCCHNIFHVHECHNIFYVHIPTSEIESAFENYYMKELSGEKLSTFLHARKMYKLSCTRKTFNF